MTEPGSKTIDLNADMGERSMHIADDIALLQFVTSTSIACGGHAGDEATARTLIQHADRLSRNVGAHPSYPDRANFGRSRLDISISALHACLCEQLACLMQIAHDEGAQLRHVKPHGALYHAASDDLDVADAIARAVQDTDPSLRLVAAAGSLALAHWRAQGQAVAAEGFADRTYEPTGLLRSRTHDDALLDDPDAAAHQALAIARDHIVTAYDGTTIPLACQTICIHSDTPNALAIARAVRATLEAHTITVAPF
ncbi:MAG: LamB/YcsF family protein [Phycisphaerales bacterium]|nr:LamB/YcsF family protein [Phycisphaerales bacterium]